MPEIGLIEVVGGGALALLILERVFSFVGKMQEKKQERAEQPAVDQREEKMLDVMEALSRQNDRNLDLMARIVPLVEQIHRTTDNYDRSGVCPLTKPEGRESVVNSLARGLRSKPD